MAATKQFLLNYDSNILLPYTTLDCILGDENADLEQAGNTGIDVITDRLLENIKQFVYRNTDKLDDPTKLDSNKIGDSSAFVLGVSALREGGTQYYTKFHQLTLDSPGHAGQYLGADGANHEVKFDASFAASDNWYSTAIEVKPSFNLDNPIDASISMSIKTSTDCFEITDGNLYSKYSTRSTLSNVTKLAQYTLNKIIEDNTADSTNWDTSTGDYSRTVNFGTNVPVQLNNGVLGPIKNIGGAKKPIYINGAGVITEFSDTEGGVKRPIYLSGGVLTVCNEKVGKSNGPIFYDATDGFTQCSGNFGSNKKFAYITGGEFAQSDASIGSNDDKPIFLKNGEFIEFSHSVPTYSGTGVGSNIKPTYVDEAGEVQECTYSVAKADNNKLIYASQGVIYEQSGNAGGSTQPVYLKNGQIVSIAASIGNQTKPIYLENGIIKEFSSKVGDKNQPVYMNGGTITAIVENIGDSLNPVYLDQGVIKQCSLKPDSISGAEVEGRYLMSNSDGNGVWGRGNTTTAGTFENIDGSVYYIVGIEPSKYGDNSFTLLTGAKRSDGTGIYFKNYELFQTSDENLKTFTGDIDINFDNLATIKKGIYHWTEDPNKISDIGIGARSLEALYPEIVDENNGVKTVAYNRLGVIALAAIDKLHLRVKELETEMKELKAEIRTLKQGK